MKIRSGFVSNSSSSSFVVLIDKDAYEKFYKDLDLISRLFLKDRVREEKIIGNKFMLFDDACGHGGEGPYDYNNSITVEKVLSCAKEENIDLIKSYEMDLDPDDPEFESDYYCYIDDLIGEGISHYIFAPLIKNNKAWLHEIHW